MNTSTLQQFMREVRRTILEDIAEALREVGFIGGNKLDAGRLVGKVPIGSARFIVQKDGVQVGDPVYIINFLGDGLVVEADPSHNRVNVSLAFANGPVELVADDLTPIEDDTTAPMFAG